MTFGLRVASSSGYDQIDSKFAAYYLQAEGVTNSGTWLSNGSWSKLFTLPEGLTFDDCLLFVRLPGDGLDMSVYEFTQKTAYVRIAQGGPYVDMNYEYRVYGPTSRRTMGSEEFGLRVHGADSQLLFDSREKFLRIAHHELMSMHVSYPDKPIGDFGLDAWVCLNGMVRVTGHIRIMGSNMWRNMCAGFGSRGGRLYLINTHRTTGFGNNTTPPARSINVLVSKDS